jgi:uncharacterized membrane protein
MMQLGYSFGTNPGIYTIGVNYGGAPTLVINNGIKPQLSLQMIVSIFYQSSEDGKKAL